MKNISTIFENIFNASNNVEQTVRDNSFVNDWINPGMLRFRSPGNVDYIDWEYSNKTLYLSSPNGKSRSFMIDLRKVPSLKTFFNDIETVKFDRHVTIFFQNHELTDKEFAKNIITDESITLSVGSIKNISISIASGGSEYSEIQLNNCDAVENCSFKGSKYLSFYNNICDIYFKNININNIETLSIASPNVFKSSVTGLNNIISWDNLNWPVDKNTGHSMKPTVPSLWELSDLIYKKRKYPQGEKDSEYTEIELPINTPNPERYIFSGGDVKNIGKIYISCNKSKLKIIDNKLTIEKSQHKV